MQCTGWGFYFHIPFCQRKCMYCDFYSYPAPENHIRRYIDYLEREVLLFKKEQMIGNERVESLYFGGGTPSLLKAEEYRRLFKTIQENFFLDENVEITLEVNPGQHASSLEKYLQAGINRLSVGVQSTVPEVLKILQRPYTVQTLLDFLEKIKRTDVPLLSFDFLYGVPTQTLDDITSDLGLIETVKPQHLSYYQCTKYTGTPYEKKVQTGELVPLSDEEIFVQEKYISEKLQKAGYRRYEISNYCLENFVSRHNLKYWNLEPYYGFGEGGCSLYNDRYLENHCGEKYYRSLEEDRLPVESQHLYEAEQMLQNKLLMGLRLMEGIPRKEIEFLLKKLKVKQAGFYKKKIIELKKDGILYIKKGKLQTKPEFYSVLDSILLEFI